MTKRLAAVFLSAVFLIGFTSPSARAQEKTDAETLKGINTVFVLLENLPEGAKVLGISEDTIKTDVELKLRLAGLHVLTVREVVGEFESVSPPFVYVSLTLTEGGEAAYIKVELHQDATLRRNGQAAFSVTTWDRGIVISHPTAQAIRGYTKDLCDLFLNDWLSVNPKK